MGRPKKYSDIELFKQKVDDYFEKENNEPFSLTGLSIWLDIDRKTLFNYSKDEKFFPIIKKAVVKTEEHLIKGALTGKYNPTFTIFLFKNHYGYSDKQDIKINDKRKIEIIDDLPGERSE